MAAGVVGFLAAPMPARFGPAAPADSAGLVQGLHQAGRRRHLQRPEHHHRQQRPADHRRQPDRAQGQGEPQVVPGDGSAGRLVPPGIAAADRWRQGAKLDYVICFPDRCVAEVPLTDARRLLQEGSGEIASPRSISRTSRTRSSVARWLQRRLDGPALQQSKLEERQTPAAGRNAEEGREARKKLEDAQNAAKAQ